MEVVLNQTPLWLISILFFVGLMIAKTLGGWFGAKGSAEASSYDHILSGVMGLLALLIAFTFGMALDRYETRRELVVAEANAIGTAAMRVGLLDPPREARLAELYRRYAETRLRYGLAGAAEKPSHEAASSELGDRIQTETLEAVRPIRETPLAAVIVTSVNDVQDLRAAREAAIASQLPATVVVSVGVYALVAAGLLGAALGAAGRAHRTMSALLFGLLTLALAMVLDLDRPRRGVIQVSQEPMARLVASLTANPQPSAVTAPP
jgi:uncharacterized membrane protein/uncharacterized membrane protein (Fun14 family)